jgi:hypothetical protein
MKKTALLTVLCLLSAQATAGLIAELHDSWGGDSLLNANAVTFQLWYSDSYFVPDPIQGTIIDWPTINVRESIGKTFSLNRGDDPDFDTFVSYLTNGVDDHFRFNIRVDGNDNTSGEDESWCIGKTDPYRSLNTNGIDMQGFTIEWIDLTINSGNDFAYRFYGTPEPCTLALLGLGGLLIRKR